MTMILLNEPVASSYRLERVHMFPGRHLGEEEFDRIQDYADARLRPLLQGARSGIVQGLEINLGPKGVEEVGFSVNPGLALAGNGQVLGLYYPLRAQWQALIDDYLAVSGAAGATGVYYLMLRRTGRKVDTTEVPPCQRAEFDPTRDSRLVVAGSLFLTRLAIHPDAADPDAAGHWPRELIENWVAADRVDAAFLAGLETAVPLALLAIRPAGAGGYAVAWLSQEAGRYEALPESGYRVLLNQVSAAMRRVMQQAAVDGQQAADLPQYLTANLHLDFLPAAGQLPLEWLQNPAATSPKLLWLPKHLGVDMVPVPEEAVVELLNRHIARRVIDLRRPAGDRIRLLLAVNEPDYRGDLLDIPPTDAQLESDIYRFFMRAYEAWRRWRRQFDALYYLLEGSVLLPAQLSAMDLPKPELPPALPQTVFGDLITQAANQLQDPAHPGTPYPYSKGVPAPPPFYSNWLQPSANGPVPPPVGTPAQDGLIVQYAITQEQIEATENKIRATRARLEKTRDYLLLQRQQLDSQTVALAALAGGVAGDGSGLQVARWLPYTEFQPLTTSGAEENEGNPTTVAGDTTSGVAAMSTGTATAVSTALRSTKETGSQNFGTKMLGASILTSAARLDTLAAKPETYSAFELSINQSRLQQLAKVAKTVVAKPAFQAKEYRFTVLDHISPEINEYAKAYYGMIDLLNTLKDLFDPTDAASVRARLRRIGGMTITTTGGSRSDGQDSLEARSRLEDPQAIEQRLDKEAQLKGADGKPLVDEQGRPVIDYKVRNSLAVKARYEALFKAGKVLTQWIAIVENRYNSIERKLLGLMRLHAALVVQLEKLAAIIQVARKELEALDGVRVEQLGDYGVAQRLLDEDWRQVYSINQERTRILTTGLRGLYYVKVRNTPVSAALADPLALRHGTSGDIVPGCDWTEDVALPQELDVFFNAVTEIPMDDWAALRGLKAGIPLAEQFDYFNRLRQARFEARTVQIQDTVNTGSLRSRLKVLHQQTQMAMQQWSLASLSQAKSSSRTQADAARVLSLEDLCAVKAGALRKPAYELREKLETCQYCLLEKLHQLPPSLRLQWAQLAEDDRLKVEDVAWWPGLEKAERDDFNATRTAAELVAWWFRQLDEQASAGGRTAMRNMIRAALIHASLGDPLEIIRGKVHVPPRIAAVGERLQVKLNRAPTAGTRLQLIDPQQRVVAVLTVEDHSEQSTQVQIVNLVQSDIQINTRFSVVANKRTALL